MDHWLTLKEITPTVSLKIKLPPLVPSGYHFCCYSCGRGFLYAALVFNLFMLETHPPSTELDDPQALKSNQKLFKSFQEGRSPLHQVCVDKSAIFFLFNRRCLNTTGCQAVDLRDLVVRPWVKLKERIG